MIAKKNQALHTFYVDLILQKTYENFFFYRDLLKEESTMSHKIWRFKKVYYLLKYIYDIIIFLVSCNIATQQVLFSAIY